MKLDQKYAMDNLYSPLITEADDIVPLDDDLKSHIAALRLRDGEHVRVLNGRGLAALCEVRRRGADVVLHVQEKTQHAPRTGLTLALGVLDHRDRFEFAVEKCTELGVSRIIPVVCDHAKHVRTTTERLRQKAIAAITQSGNPWLPVIDEPTPFGALQLGSTILLGDIDGGPPSPIPPCDTWIMIGPEGGFSANELSALRTHPNLITWRIGHNRLRAETAAVAMVAMGVANSE